MITRRHLLQISAGAMAVMTADSSLAQEPSEQAVFFDKNAPVLGNAKGNVTVVEYFDYQCPHCKTMHPTLMKVVKEDGNVRLVMKDWPVFGDVSVFAAQATLGAAQIGKYEAALEALMSTSGRLTHESIEEALTGRGMTMKEIAAAVNKHFAKISGLLDRNYLQAVAFGFIGTPSFVIGRTTYPGVLDEKGLREAIAAART
ncbi:DSBA oxidoreductase [Agaricicola taiwanensis]|uniref:DSBA oxidoreductase n=1 Tax=Agaricicola taiwanensis TaxID=591372 RepID=A0A8J2VWL6_9RHOB|nr:DsbA family protein [Agaricicola taiwanensis]GGE39633.1 DSBA oxidoreductase [Agaricicola taiwanensis]